MDSRPKTTWGESVVAIIGLAVLAGSVILVCYWVHNKPANHPPRHACPYCGEEIKIKLEPNGKEKKP